MITLLSALGLAVPELIVSAFVGPELAVMGGFYRHHGSHRRLFPFRPVDNPEYAMDINPAHVPLRGGLLACLPFILIFVFLLLTSKLVPLHPCTAHGY